VKRNVAEIEIYDRRGRRKYLTDKERRQFRACAETVPADMRGFCLMFFFTGLRISEALELTPERLDAAQGAVLIRTLKRRTRTHFRAVPLPRAFLKELQTMAAGKKPEDRLWPFSRRTGYRHIKKLMKNAGISGAHACPKGLRHGFGIACVQKNIPLPTVSKWMGHSSIATTAIYLNAMGDEERQFAKRIW
jgi:integrase